MPYEWSRPLWGEWNKTHLVSINSSTLREVAACNRNIELDPNSREDPFLSTHNMGLCQKCLRIFVNEDKMCVDEINREKIRLGEVPDSVYEPITKQLLKIK